MKKIITHSFLALFAIGVLASCGASKKGCGLTSDAAKIEIEKINQELIAERK
jgi:hypothetical protein